MQDLLHLLESVLGTGQKEGKNYRFFCPFPECQGSSRPKLSIIIDTDEEGNNLWMCWGDCKNKGKTIRSLFFKIAEDKVPLVDSLIPRQYITSKEKKDVSSISLELPKEMKKFQNLSKYDLIGKQSLAYLRRRGFTDDDILKYNLGYCETGKYRNRIIFPSYDVSGQLNYFVGRTIIEDEEPRYLPAEVSRKNIIPFELFINWKAPIILCEGFFDAKTIARNAIPLLEKEITPGIMKKLLSNAVKDIYIVLDRDALKNAINHAEILISEGKRVYLVELDDKDPSKMGFEAFTKMIHEAKETTWDEIVMKKMRINLYE